MRDGKEIQISLPMKENATPIAQKQRRVPYLLTEPLKKRIEEFEENDIIEKVPDHEAITWCSPLVVQPKRKNPEDIRACLDLRLLNKSMLRTRDKSKYRSPKTSSGNSRDAKSSARSTWTTGTTSFHSTKSKGEQWPSQLPGETTGTKDWHLAASTAKTCSTRRSPKLSRAYQESSDHVYFSPLSVDICSPTVDRQSADCVSVDLSADCRPTGG